MELEDNPLLLDDSVKLSSKSSKKSIKKPAKKTLKNNEIAKSKALSRPKKVSNIGSDIDSEKVNDTNKSQAKRKPKDAHIGIEDKKEKKRKRNDIDSDDDHLPERKKVKSDFSDTKVISQSETSPSTLSPIIKTVSVKSPNEFGKKNLYLDSDSSEESFPPGSKPGINSPMLITSSPPVLSRSSYWNSRFQNNASPDLETHYNQRLSDGVVNFNSYDEVLQFYKKSYNDAKLILDGPQLLSNSFLSFIGNELKINYDFIISKQSSLGTINSKVRYSSVPNPADLKIVIQTLPSVSSNLNPPSVVVSKVETPLESTDIFVLSNMKWSSFLKKSSRLSFIDSVLNMKRPSDRNDINNALDKAFSTSFPLFI